MIGVVATAFGLLMINRAESDKQIAIGGIVASLGVNMLAHDYRTSKET